MAFIGKTFDYQSVTAGDDGFLYKILSGNRDMIVQVSGSTFSITNNVLTTGQLLLVISGRVIRVEANTTISLGTIPTSATKGRVIIRLDMTKLATETSLRQIETEVETTSGSFRTLTQQNINSIGGQTLNKYEAVLCTFTCSSGTASAPVSALSTQLSYPLSIANGGTGATSSASARTNLGVMPLKHYQSSDSWSEYSPSLTHIENIYAYAGETSIVDCYFTGNTYRCIAIVNYGGTGWGSLAILERPQRIKSLWSFSKINNTWHETTSVPQITKITFNGSSSAGALQNLKIQSAEVLSGNSFVDTTTSAWNYYVPVGTYRITLQAQFPTGSASDYYGIMAGKDATPNYSLACQFGCGLSVVQRLNASGIMVNTNSSEAHSLIVRSNKALTDCSGFLTIEKLS